MKRLSCAILLQFLWLTAAYAQAPVQDLTLLQNAQSGDARAQFSLARVYEQGSGAAQSDAQAVYWYRKSAEQDYPEAENSLGVMYALGRGVPLSREEALQWYRKAAKHGLAQAFYNIAISYYNGDGVDQDLDASYAFMLLAQSKGNAQAAEALPHLRHDLQGDVGPAKLRMAEMLESGDDLPRDLQGAIKVYLELADSGPKRAFAFGQPYAQAEYRLCQFYFEGKVVAQDYSQAKSRCRLAAKYLPVANLLLGKMDAAGLGGHKDAKRAAQYYQAAAVASVPEGFFELAKLKLDSGSHQAAKEAYFWLYVARQQKAPVPADFHNATVALSGQEVASIEKEARDWLARPPRERDKPRIR
jgi:TPR repeat protein